MAKYFFEAYIACLLMFLIPIAIIITSKIKDFTDSRIRKSRK
ncbi:MAG: hypothetical protein P4L59_00500 [Desulfosporosinus sp.]|nr:hypothetical protein [Desulfosporosinus sp.]